MISPLEIDLSHDNPDVWTLKLSGSVDITNHHLLWSIYGEQALLEKILETEAKKLVIDLSEVDRMDSQGLRHLHDIYRLFESTDIQLTLKNPNSHLYRLLQIMQFDTIYNVEFDNNQP